MIVIISKNTTGGNRDFGFPATLGMNKEMHLADTLTRPCLNEEKEDLFDEELEMSLLDLELSISPEKLTATKDCSSYDNFKL